MTQVSPPVWQASEAQSRLGELVDAALDGAPQVVRRADGREVVVVAREVFQAPDESAPRETLRDVLLNPGFTLEEDDPFFTDIAHARTLLGASLPAPYLNEGPTEDALRAGHERGERDPQSSR
jgi:hypothetical protein